jgi:hypothetical protein
VSILSQILVVFRAIVLSRLYVESLLLRCATVILDQT